MLFAAKELSLYEKYKALNNEILKNGIFCKNKKGENYFIAHVYIKFTPEDIKDFIKSYKLPTCLLNKELDLYRKGEIRTKYYNNEGIKWWDYAGKYLINTYPNYIYNLYKFLDRLYLQLEKNPNSNSRTWYFSFYNNEISSQVPCISSIQIINTQNKKLFIIITQRSGDLSLGVPADWYQINKIFTEHLISAKFEITYCWNYGNLHIYKNNIDLAADFVLRDIRPKYNLNVDKEPIAKLCSQCERTLKYLYSTRVPYDKPGEYHFLLENCEYRHKKENKK